jgi:hypothetical protein
MTDQNRSAKAQEPEPTARPYNNPNLSPIEFLEAAMHCDTLSIALRVKAARALTSIHTKAPQPPVTIRIKDPYSHEYLARFPWLKEFATKDPEQTNAISQSKSRIRSNSHQPSSETPPPLYTETNSNSPSLIDYSKPPTPEEIQQIKAAVHALRPDLAHLPVPEFHLCPCGHWITGSYPCCEALSDKTKLN